MFSLRRALYFTAQFVPLFLLCLWVYSKAVPVYQPAVIAAASAVTRNLPSPSAIEVNAEGQWWAYSVSPDGSRKSIDRWPAYMTHLLFLSLAFLPALILATPAPVVARLRLLLIGLLLLALIHVLSVIGLVRQTQCLVAEPGSFHCLWILRLVYASGQIFGALLWGLLTWRYWFPQKSGDAGGTGSAGALACLAVLLLTTGCGRAEDRPNVIVLVVDTLRADHLGSYGFPGDNTPALDRLAAESLVFDNAYAQAPWTKPSTASLFTSLYPQVHRVTTHEGEDWGGVPGREPSGSKVLAPQAVTLAEAFRDGGYRTAAFVANPFISALFGFDQGFDVYDVRTDFAANRADHLAAAGREWIEAQRAGGDGAPFFLYLHFMDVHAPYAAPRGDHEAVLDDIQATGKALRDDQRPDRRFRNIEVQAPWATGQQRRTVDYWRARYASGVRMLDRRLASFLEYLEESDLLESTVVVLTSDHGEELFEHGSWSHGYSYHDHQLRVPLVIRVPGADGSPARTPAPAEAVDVMPTLLSIAGIAAPEGVQGRDLSGLLNDGRADPGRACFAAASLAAPRSYALWTPEHKLILDLADGRSRLFDLSLDPEEQRDVARDDPALVARLSVRLREHLDASVADGVLDVGSVDVPPEVLESIEALGYVGR